MPVITLKKVWCGSSIAGENWISCIRQKTAKKLHVEDGWIQVIAEVFRMAITGKRFAEIVQIGNALRQGR